MMSTNDEELVGAENPVIWHYMEAWKFNNLLDSRLAIEDWKGLRTNKPGTTLRYIPSSQGSLWFGLPDSFGDRREATFPALNDNDEDYCREIASFLQLDPTESQEKKQRFLARNTAAFRRCVRGTAKLCGVTCWHKSDVESPDMWSVFASNPEDVAIKTNLKDVMGSLGRISGSVARKASVRPSDVQYIDHSNYFAPYDGYREILTFVRSDYDYECELRLTGKSPQLLRIPMALDKPSSDADYEDIAGLLEQSLSEWLAAVSCNTAFPGFYVPVDLSRLVDEIRVNPDANTEDIESIRTAVGQNGLSGSVVLQSSLATGT